jgi:hypothetical protein
MRDFFHPQQLFCNPVDVSGMKCVNRSTPHRLYVQAAPEFFAAILYMALQVA